MRCDTRVTTIGTGDLDLCGVYGVYGDLDVREDLDLRGDLYEDCRGGGSGGGGGRSGTVIELFGPNLRTSKFRINSFINWSSINSFFSAIANIFSILAGLRTLLTFTNLGMINFKG